MKIKIVFEKSSRYFSLEQPLDFDIYLYFLETNYEEFYNWLDKTEKRRIQLADKYKYFADIGYSEKVIKFSKL